MRSVYFLKTISFVCVTAFFMVILSSCKKDKLKDEKLLLEGNWKWSYTQHTYGWCSGLAFYEIISPLSENNNYSISFIERGKVIFYKNDIKQKKYRIVFDKFLKLEESYYSFQLKLDNDTTKIVEGTVKTDTLSIKYPYVESDPNCENYLNFFVRE